MSDTSKEPKMIALKCPQCGGALELDTDKEVATCPYCNTRLLIVRSIEQNNVINYNIRIEDNGKKNSKSSFPFEKPDSGRIKTARETEAEEENVQTPLQDEPE